MRISTVSLGRIGGLGDCLIADQVEGMCPDGSPYLGTLDSGGAAPSVTSPGCYVGEIDPVTGDTIVNCGAPATGGGGITPAGSTSAPSALNLPLSIPSLLLPGGVKPSSTGLPISGMQCPTGYVQSGSVCVPVATVTGSTMIPGVSNTVIYAAGALLLVVAMMSGGKGRR